MFKDTLYSQPAGRTIEPVQTPAGLTYVRTLMTGEKDQLEIESGKDKMIRAHIIVACCCDEHGNAEFTKADLYRLNDQPVHLIEPIVEAAIRLNRIGPDDAEIIRKNLQVPDANSSTG